jgi:hypothetical protein
MLLFSKHEAHLDSDGSWYLALSDTGYLYFEVSGTTVYSTGHLDVGQWTHCVFRYNSTNQNWSYYLNGVLDSGGTNNLAIQATDWPLRIGTELQFDGETLDYFLDGALDNLRIYNRALSSTEVAQLYAHESVPPSSLIGFEYASGAVLPTFSNLTTGINYQLQISPTLTGNFTNYGSPFIATNSSMVYAQYFAVSHGGQSYFRVTTSP